MPHVTVMSRAVYAASRKQDTPASLPWAVAAPDGMFFGPTFDWAKEFAFSYGLNVSFL